MTQFRKYNLIVGWAVFLIATITYGLTIEPTSSLWDCGEFIASAYKLEVGHPPGAPLFMIIAKIFSLFAFGNTAKVAMMINFMSGLASAFTILFLFWTITHIAKKIMAKIADSNEFTLPQLAVIMGSGAVGALAYTFSDTFWFSAVEAEVYAMSSLFTAMVFWAILRWEDVAHEKYADRWIILIAFLMGLSIGVHLLNLLAIPAIALVYYFKKFKPTLIGAVATFFISFFVLIFIMYGIIQGLVVFASKFELVFVNSFGLPINSGFLFYVLFLLALVAGGLVLTHKYQKPILNTIVLAFTVILIGYSSFALIIIRSSANPPMDENNPENAFALKSYLNREQYGDRPLIFGHYYNASVTDQKDQYTYIQLGDKYKKIKKPSPKYYYDQNYLFPRIYSSDDNHVSAYKSWGNIKGEPNFINNISYFVKYQIGFMYFRYFMWNFAGRQNDEQGHGRYHKGNWISGFFADKNMPDYMKNDPTRNKYFLLPLLLGILGLVVNFSYKQEDFWVVTALFIMTGLAIVVYLNQTPYQPRERDYAYAGSFYAFAIWIGLGVMFIYDILKKIKKPAVQAGIAVGLSILIPVQMAVQNWNDHDRSGRYTTIDFAKNYLNSCAPNAILFTYGDNDTFPLWYAQEVEGIRTDVRVVNLSLLSTDWYTEQMTRKAYESEKLPITLSYEQYMPGKRDFVPIREAAEYMFFEKYTANKAKIEKMYEPLLDTFAIIAQNSSFPEQEKDAMKQINAGTSEFDAVSFISLINTLNKPELIKKYNFNAEDIKSLAKAMEPMIVEIMQSPVYVKDAMNFIVSESRDTKVGYGADEIDFLPVNYFKLPVNKQNVLASGAIPKDKESEILDEIEWKIGKSYLMKSQMIILEILAHNNWERPIYFASSVGADNYLGLTKYFQLEGFAYRLVPYETTGNPRGVYGSVNSEILYDNLMNKFQWGNIKEDHFHADHYIKRVASIMDIRDVFHRLAEDLIAEKQNEKAEQVLDRCIAEIPHHKIPYDFSALPLVEDYYKIGKFEKGNEIAKTMHDYYLQQLDYYTSLNNRKSSAADREKQIAVYVIQQLLAYAQEYEQEEMLNLMSPSYQKYSFVLGLEN